MKKKITVALSLMIVFMLGINQIKADDQSGGSVGGSGGGTGDYTYTNGRVPYSKGYRVSIVKYKSGVDSQPILIKSKNFLANDVHSSFLYSGRTVKYIETPVPKTSELNSDGTKKTLNWKIYSYDSKIPSYEYGPFVFNGNTEDYDYSVVKNYFDDLAQPSKTAELKTYLKNTMGFELEELEDCQDIRYYYVLVEPMLAITYNGVYYYGTVAELSTIWVIGGMSKYLFTPDTSSFHITENGTNVNIPFWYDGIGYSPGETTNILAKNGYGVGTLWIGGFSSDCKKCYKKSTKTTNGKLACINNDQNNYETYTETYEEISCDKATKEEETNTENGKLIHKTSNCKIYCIESAVASFPGNVTETTLVRKDIFGGTYFMWPTKEKNSIYSMHMTSKYTCTIVTESGKTCSQTDINTLTNAAKTKVSNLKHSVSLTAGNNLPLDNEQLDIASTETNKNEKEGSKYVFEKTTYFKIPDNKNRYINKSNGNILDYARENCFDRGEGTISLRSDTDISKQYELKLTNLKLGVFTEKLPKNYSCNYSIKKISCDCPPYTLREGETLDEEVAKNPDMSCAELQEEYCGKVACIDDKGVQHDITSCVQEQEKKGLSYKEAYDKCSDEVCYPNDKYYCLKNNGDIYLKNNKPVELKTCMDEYVKQGMSKEYAYNACFEEKCNICYTREGKTADIEDCMKLYKNYNICESLYCPNTPCPGGKCINYCKDVKADKCKWSITSKKDTKITLGYKCDDSDKGINEFCNWVNIQCPGGNEKMEEPENCVSGKLGYENFAEVIKALNSGKITASDVSNAFTKCESTVCPGTKKLNKIIYRTIDLKDPFPGKKGNSRKPGYNWNSKIRIEREILKGRGTNDYDIYKKEPLMVITLDSKAIKQIKEYNKNNEYSDFKLIQVQNASKKVSGYYTSKFIRETIKENVKYSDDCKDISTIEKFNKCYNNDN